MRAVRRRWYKLSALALWGLVILLVGAFVGGGRTAGQEQNRAGLVVTFEGGATEARCLEFAEEEISGAELLRRSGLSVVFSGFGGLGEGVCRIGDTGCSDPGDCFCQCRGAECAYWSYFGLRDGEWQFQSLGPSQRALRDGDVDGWIWGSGRTPPEPVAFGELCPVSASNPPPSLAWPTAATGPSQGSATVESPAESSAPSGPGEPAGPQRRPQPAAPPTLSQPPEANGEPIPAGPIADGTPPATGESPQVVGPSDGSESDRGAADVELEARIEDESGGGPPAGLIAFAGVAGLLAATIGGLALRRRLGG